MSKGKIVQKIKIPKKSVKRPAKKKQKQESSTAVRG